MISMTKQMALDYADLRFLEITCKSCGAKMLVDAQSERSQAPYQCHACGERFDPVSIQSPVRSFIDIYKVLTNPNQKNSFRVIVSDSTS